MLCPQCNHYSPSGSSKCSHCGDSLSIDTQLNQNNVKSNWIKENWFKGILIILIIFLWIHIDNQAKKIVLLESDNEELNIKLRDAKNLVIEYQDALQEANDNLEAAEIRLNEYQDALQEANDNIDEAKNYTWESYQEMGEALENLSTVDEP